MKEKLLENTGDNKNGFVIEFENQPDKSSLIYKIATQINSSKKFFIPWRFFESDIDYNNPYFSYKTLFGSLFSDDKKIFNYTIKLPYAYLTYYISDKEGYAIKDLIIKISKENRDNIKKAKNTLEKKSNIYFNAINVVKDLEKAKNDANKIKETLKKNEDELKMESSLNLKLLKEKKELQKKVFGLRISHHFANNEYDKLVSELNNNNKQIVLLHQWIEKVKNSKDSTKFLEDENKKANDALQNAQGEFIILRTNAEERKKEIDDSEKGLKNEDKISYQSNLDKISPL